MAKRIKGRKREAVPAIRLWNDPILKQVCDPVEEGEDIGPIIRGMCQALRKTKIGVGLAAPQIGIPKQIIVINPWDKPLVLVMINPVIESFSGGPVVRRDLCLSYPGRFVPITRSKEIEVTYLDDKFIEHKEQFFEGMAARIVQHELDHLKGICKVAGDK